MNINNGGTMIKKFGTNNKYCKTFLLLAFILYFILTVNPFINHAFALDALGLGLTDSQLQNLKNTFLTPQINTSPITPLNSNKSQADQQFQQQQQLQQLQQQPQAETQKTRLDDRIDTAPQPEVEKPKKPLLLFERYRSLDKFQSISLDLQPYGYDFFSKELSVRKINVERGITDEAEDNKDKNAVFNAGLGFMKDVKTAAVSDNYVVGPGDYVVLTLWGRIEARYSMLVDSSGNISVPNLGFFKVGGMRFSDVRNMLKQKAEQIVGAKANISMGGLKLIQVYVLGEVFRPGMYPTDSMSTIINALFLSGGPQDVGSLRNIELRRNGKVIIKFDMYELFLKGDKSHDLVLENGDIIFVPPVGVLVGIAGNVKRPAIYELRDKFDLNNLLSIAGGINPSAYTQQIQIDRIVNHEKQMVIDVNLKEIEKSKNFQLWDGDLVKVFTISEQIENYITLEGNVKRPGRYEFKQGMHISDIIAGKNDLLDETSYDYAVIKRLMPPNNSTHSINFNIGKVIFDKDKANDLELNAQDIIYVFSTWAFNDKPQVVVRGEVRALESKGEFRKMEYQHRGLIEKSNQILSRGLKIPEEMQFEIDKLESEIAQKYPYSTSLSESNLKKLKAQADLFIARGLLIPIKMSNDIETLTKLIENKKIYVSLLATRLKLKQLMSKTKAKGGVAYKINSDMYNDIRKLEINLENNFTSTELIKLRLGELKVKVEGIESKGIENSKEVQSEIESLEQEITNKSLNLTLDNVNVPIVKNSRVKDAILSAGGLTQDALLDKGEIIRYKDDGQITRIFFNVKSALNEIPADNVELQDKDEVIVHSIWEKNYKQEVFIEGEIGSPGKYTYYTGMKVSDLIFMAGNLLESAYMDEAEIYSSTLIDGKEVRKSYKTINLSKLFEGDTSNDTELKSYDRLYIKRIPQWGEMIFVRIDGEVKFPGRYVVKKGERLSSVISRAGGFTEYAYLRGSVFTRDRVKELQQKQIDEMVQRLEIELLSRGSAEAASALSSDTAALKQQEISQKMVFIDKLKSIKAKGRMVLHVRESDALSKTSYDIEVEEGDVLFIPSNPRTIQIIGSVYNQTAFVYDKLKDFSDYVTLAGGYSENADDDRAYILKVDGTAIRPRGSFFGTRMGQKMESGDTIVIPEKLVKVSWLRDVRDITQILYQIAITTGVMIPLLGL